MSCGPWGLEYRVLGFGDEAGEEVVRRNGVMLVLSRKKNESIVINNDITIVVVEIRGDKVRLGVEAPKEVPVHRREVYDAIRRNEMVQRQEPTESAGEKNTLEN